MFMLHESSAFEAETRTPAVFTLVPNGCSSSETWDWKQSKTMEACIMWSIGGLWATVHDNREGSLLCRMPGGGSLLCRMPGGGGGGTYSLPCGKSLIYGLWPHRISLTRQVKPIKWMWKSLNMWLTNIF